MRGDAHVRFGGRSEETGGPRGPHRVSLRPYYNILEGACEVVLANARDIKNVPGRKTDAEWLADLLRHGLIRGSFIPPKPIRDLREVVRYRKALIRERASEISRLQKVLEGMNIKLASVASNVLGVSGRAMLEAIAAGCADAEALAEMPRGRLRNKIPELEKALEGRVDSHHRFLLAQQLRHIDYLDELIEACTVRIEEMMRPFEEKVALLCEITGVEKRTVQAIIAEIGVDAQVPHRQAHRLLGRCLPGEQRERGQEEIGQDQKGEPLAERGPGRSRSRCQSSQGHLLLRAFPPPCCPPR
ncbi:MAG: transposase [Bacillota bacterium]|nr:transposase [Bacillota bacterium]